MLFLTDLAPGQAPSPKFEIADVHPTKERRVVLVQSFGGVIREGRYSLTRRHQLVLVGATRVSLPSN